MAKKNNDLAHTKWMCKYHIVFTPKYRRKVIDNQYRRDLGEILSVGLQLMCYKQDKQKERGPLYLSLHTYMTKHREVLQNKNDNLE